MGAAHPQLPHSFQVLELSTGQAPRRAQGMKTKLKWTFQTLMYEQWVLLSLLISRGGKVLARPTLEPPGVLVARASSELSHGWAVTASHPSSRLKDISICQFVFPLSTCKCVLKLQYHETVYP